MEIDKNTPNKKYLYGDFDNDGVPNLDDRQPFNERSKRRVNKEVSLTDAFLYVEQKRKDARHGLNKVVSGLKKQGYKLAGKPRVKELYSVINKNIRRYPFVSNDFIGARVEYNKRVQARKGWKRYNKHEGIKNTPSKSPESKSLLKYEEISGDNKYVANKGSKNLYRAYHTNTVVNVKDVKNKNNGRPIRFGVEIQFRTKKYGKLNDNMHTEYKKTGGSSKLISKSKWLLKNGY